MKKLFLMFLIVALVPFAVGCGGGGSDNNVLDYTTLTNSVTLPNALVAPANLRAAKLSYKNLYLEIGGYKFTPAATPAPVYNAASDTWTIAFESTMTGAQAAALRTQSSVAVKVIDGTTAAAPVTLVTATVNLAIASTSTIVPTIVVDLTGGNLQIKYIGGLTTDIVTNPVSAEPTITTFSVAGVVATNAVTLVAGTATSADADFEVIATITAPVFTVEFSEAYTLPTGVSTVADLRWVIHVKNVDGPAFTLDSAVAADKALFTLAANGTTKIDITVLGGSTKKLEADKKYVVTFADSDLTTADGDALAKATYLFKTPAN